MKIFLNFCLKKKKNYRISLPFENRKIKAPTLLAWKIISIPINLRIILNSSDPSRLFPRLFHYKTRFANKSLLKFSLKISLKRVRIYARKNYYSIRLANCFNNNRAKRARLKTIEKLREPLPPPFHRNREKNQSGAQCAARKGKHRKLSRRKPSLENISISVPRVRFANPSPPASCQITREQRFVGRGIFRGELARRNGITISLNSRAKLSLCAINSNLCTSYPESRPFPATFREKKRVVGGRKGGKERRIEK